MEYVLENEHVRLECMEQAGQMKHFIDKDRNVELLYQGDQGWSGRNPSLFPIVGNTWTKDYKIDGKTYAMKNHGLIRYADLKGKQERDAILFTFDSNEDTKAQYPFDFHYEMRYTLEQKTCKIHYSITNTGVRTMPFTFGLHPAFRIPQKPGEVFEDYSFVFEKEEHAKQMLIDRQPHELKDVTFKEWKLSYEEIYQALTIIYQNLQSKYLTVCYKGEPRIRFHFDGFPYLAIWTHEKKSDFICIEPWYGHADFEPGHDDFYTREGTMCLEPGETFETEYSYEAL
ncbi:aldose 1-epimerase family protein [Faecalicoccus acidiformans]|uniref:aldose epimerase family protein n=1 Tax=Faecalicoccus acidiformans TaxID=915173 RepID=UPI002357A3EB|nr:aldose 1-epimerase family protein [Faecalicoccus acidiformans]